MTKLLTYSIYLLFNSLNAAKKKADESSSTSADDSSDSKSSKSSKSSSAGSNVNTKGLEGVWSSNFYYNHTASKTVVRGCNNVTDITWTIKGNQWFITYDHASQDKDLICNSNGKWTIREVSEGEDKNTIKAECYENNTDLKRVCAIYQKNLDGSLNMMFNYTNIETCPQRFNYFSDSCSNSVDYSVATCKSGKCLAKDKLEADTANTSSAIKIYSFGLITTSLFAFLL